MTKLIIIVVLACLLAATLITLWEYTNTVNAMYWKLSQIRDYTLLQK